MSWTRSDFINPEILRRQYSTDEKLRVRIETHLRFSTATGTWADWLLDLLDVQGDERVLDIGTGNGGILLPLARRLLSGRGHVTGLDMSAGMIEGARRTVESERLNVTFVLGDAQHLPFPDASFDIVMANHMLYHVPDIEAAVREAYRLLKPGGIFLAATNTERNMPQLGEIAAQAVRAAGLADRLQDTQESGAPARRFSLENGMAFLAPVFGSEMVAVYLRDDSLRFEQPEPLLEYYATLRKDDPRINPDEWEVLYREMYSLIQNRIETQGVLKIDKQAGAFLARKSGEGTMQNGEQQHTDEAR